MEACGQPHGEVKTVKINRYVETDTVAGEPTAINDTKDPALGARSLGKFGALRIG